MIKNRLLAHKILIELKSELKKKYFEVLFSNKSDMLRAYIHEDFDFPTTAYTESRIKTDQLIVYLNKPKERIQDAIDLLESNKHVEITKEEKGKMINITHTGKMAIDESYYLVNGLEVFGNVMYNQFKWLLPAAAFLLALLAFIKSCKCPCK